MPDDARENTDLIDVADVAAAFDEATDAPLEGHHADRPTVSAETEISIASFKDRFAAWLIDAVLLGISFGIFNIFFSLTLLPVGIFAVLALVVGVLFEGILFATPGKLMCGLRVQSVRGNHPGFGGVLIRNILRPLDLVLSMGLVGLVVFEKTTWHQRLGDLLSRTVVVRRRFLTQTPEPFLPTQIASASGRVAAAFIDAIILGSFMIGLGLLLSVDAKLVNELLLLFAPLVIGVIIILPEVLTGTSPGKLVFGFVLREENGTSVTTSSAVVRCVYRMVDLTPWGVVALWSSPLHQRLGDAAAGTVVGRAPRSLKGLIGSLLVILTAGVLLAAGLNNRDSLIREKDLHGEISKYLTFESAPTLPFGIQHFAYAGGSADRMRSPPIFSPGETLFLNFEVMGCVIKGGQAWLQEDLSVRYPDDRIGLKLDTIAEFHDTLSQPGPIALSNTMVLPDNAVEGRYAATITIRDKFSGKELKEQRFFYVSKPVSP